MRDVQEYLNDEKLRRKSRCFVKKLTWQEMQPKRKSSSCGSRRAYFISAMLAGNVCWFAVLLALQQVNVKRRRRAGCEVYYGRLLWRCLSLVLMAGAELFTGSNFVMAVGMFQKKVTFQDSVTVWVTCWLGNLAGSVLVAGMYSLTGLCTGSVQAIMADTTAMKMSVEPLPLFMRAILCNILVCLAVWCGIKRNRKQESRL